MKYITNRKFKLVVNRTMSGEDILLGVPQGMVLASVLFFFVMISDIGK